MQSATTRTLNKPAPALLDASRPLRDLLAAMLVEHQTLDGLLQEQRESIRRADGAALASAADRHARTLTRITDLESQRAALVAAWPHTRGRKKQPTLSEVASSLPEPGRSECLSLAAKLRETLENTRATTTVLRAASSSLLAHMEGLMRQVSRRLSHAGTYGRSGEVEPVGSVVSALDLTR